MLKGISPLLTPDLLKILAEMGHDDAIVLTDANFTTMSLGAGKPVVRLPASNMLQVVRAITSVLPLVEDASHPVAFMHVSGTENGYLSGLQRELSKALEPILLPQQSHELLDRHDFYARARSAYAFVVTGEMQPYANVILRKGFIGETLRV